MPQMAPINWLLMFIMFSMIFLFNMMNYYLVLPSSPTSKKLNELKTNLINWKW